MSVADKIERLQQAKTAIANAITNQGGTVASEDGFEEFSADIGTIPAGGTPYEGPYTVTPQTDDAVVLATDGKTAASDITVEKIPYSLVDNPQGGKTATIGS